MFGVGVTDSLSQPAADSSLGEGAFWGTTWQTHALQKCEKGIEILRRDAMYGVRGRRSDGGTDAIHGVPTGFIHTFVIELSFMRLPWVKNEAGDGDGDGGIAPTPFCG